MRVAVAMPLLSDSMTEGAVTSWFRRVGETVAEGEALAEIETGKSTVDLAAPVAGVLASIVVEGGAGPVPVGTVLAEVETDAAAAGVVAAHAAAGGGAAAPGSAAAAAGEGKPAAASATSGDAAPATSTVAAPRANAPDGAVAEGRAAVAASAPPARAAVAPTPPPVAAQATPAADEARVPATPLARRMAAQAGVALNSLVPTGAGGKVCAADVEAALGRSAAAATAGPVRPAAARPASQAPAAPVVLPPGAVRVSRVHRTMASRMAQAKSTIPHFYLWVDARVDHLLELRRHLQADGVQVSLNDFVVWAAGVALRHVPEANASWVEGSADAVVRHDQVNIAIAVAVEDGLVAPVIRDVDKLGLAALGSAIRELAGRAREGKLTPPEHEGGTFTVSNLGMFGVQGMVAIVNPPQACILGVGAAEARAVVEEGHVVPGTVMTLVLSADHRVIDGATGARFLAEVKRLLEEPARVLV